MTFFAYKFTAYFNFISHLWIIRIVELTKIWYRFKKDFTIPKSSPSGNLESRPPFAHHPAHFAERGGKRWKGKIEIRNHTRYRTFLWNREYLAQQRGKRIVDSRGEECFHYTGDVLYSKSNMTRHAHSRIEDVIHRLKSSMRNEFDKCRREKKKIQASRSNRNCDSILPWSVHAGMDNECKLRINTIRYPASFVISTSVCVCGFD